MCLPHPCMRKEGIEMNGSIRVSAKTVDDAITEALIQLGVTSDRLEYEVIEKGSPGFLGIGMKQAVIEARRKPEPEPEPEPEEVFAKPEKPEIKETKKEAPVHKKKEKAERKPKKEKEVREVKEEEKPEEPKREETVLAEVQDVTIQAVEDFLKNTLTAMNMEVEIKSEIDSDGALSVEMSGEHMGILFGKRG